MRWLKKWIRDWLEDDEPPRSLEIKIGDDRTEVFPERAVGTALFVTWHQGSRVITAAQAVDKYKYWKVWKAFSKGSKIQWEDGDKFDPQEERR